MMKKLNITLLKLSILLSLFLLCFNYCRAQDVIDTKEDKLITSVDLTQYGSQIRIAYDFYTKHNKCIGFSISQAGGIYKEADAYFYDIQDCRINLSFRFTNYLYQSKRANIFGLFSAGVSYNTFITGEHMVLPSLHLGMGVDLPIIKSSGVRLEAGYGSPYLASAGYFFKF
jgi:hypothetical protein